MDTKSYNLRKFKCLWCKHPLDPTLLKELGRYCSKECLCKAKELKEDVTLELERILEIEIDRGL